MRRLHVLRFVGGLLLGTLTLASCSMVNPYISHPRDTLSTQDTLPRETGDLETAVSYANTVKANYREALGREATFTNVLGALLIPTSAMALTMGIAKVHSNTILMTGGSGTALLGVGKWLESKPRQAAYVAGYNAVNCAIEAVLPFRFSKKHLEPFQDSMQNIDGRIEAVQEAIGEAEAAKSQIFKILTPAQQQAKDDPQLLEAVAHIRVAKSVVASARDARDKGFAVQRQRARAGHALDATVDNIIGQVDAAIQKSQLDLGALSAVISGLSQAYSQFTTVSDNLKPKDVGEAPEGKKTNGMEQQRQKLKDAIDALKTAVDELLEDKQEISKIVNFLTPEHSLAALKKCGVEPATISTTLTLSPAGNAEFTARKDGVQQAARSILGGKKPFGVVVPHPVTGLHITQPVAFGRAITITAETSLLQPGTYPVHVVDGNERTTHFNIVVE